ncbi:class I SAM-dependent methyltransferase [Ectothiorhodospira variabilis]|uniref:class I SAM-dependent methyltransferase n=1 Tax=Ectothiorhodospira variabilis TaxID=505694 RepID=UPI001EFAA1E0|nr:class I SAM-dependent methyltransferase [Ectothiorhodospira variabilis]MCG5497552.1 class I SAM-dependent methyltransferase [Ectothiorhodospira variabilis]
MTRPGFEEQWRRRFVERGQRFQDDAGIAGWSTSGLETRLRNFQRVWQGDVPDALWVDAGCGAGSYTRYLAERGVCAIGLDYSLPSVQKARARSHASIPWAVGDATQLPIQPGSLDGVMCFGVLQALSRPEDAVRELTATVRPGGQIWVDALNRDCLSTRARRFVSRLLRRPLNLRYDRHRQLVDWLHQHGGVDVKVHWVPILPGRLQRFQPWVEHDYLRRLLARVPAMGALLSHAILLSARKA